MQIKIGDKVIEADNSSGVPVIKATAEEIRHPDGRVDVVVKIPCLKIQSKQNKRK